MSCCLRFCGTVECIINGRFEIDKITKSLLIDETNKIIIASFIEFTYSTNLKRQFLF